ncbi:beta-1,3-galactosyltransferase brn-like [Pecten maximus]|uniref:beta-1,3-galactosyltransferase brn-like n=1 Tax=Pecten maximus TaxID=6579 RepID=UPI001457EA9F|nr:beta-1,3-galactosyltransferase brn-like [Pecten maximus]
MKRDDSVPYYSEFDYPVKMDFITSFKEYKANGRLPTDEIINPHPFQYIHLREECNFKEKGTAPLLILVKSTATNFHLRHAIRATWGNVTGMNVEIAFLLGYRADQKNDVTKEMELYGDIVQENFEDSYMNNTYKTIMGFNWAVQYCNQASHIVFVDDDHYINIPNIISYINTLRVSFNDDIMVGNLLLERSPFRFKYSKWYVSSEQYPFDKWPPYLAGAVFLMSRESAIKMAFAFPYIKYLGIDDSYLGIVASKVGIAPRHEARFVIPPYLLYTDPSQMVYGEFKDLAEFKIVHSKLEYFAEVKMCVFTWKCQFAFLL